MFAALTLFALLAPSAHAFFRLPCAKPVLDAIIDPIVSPGRQSSHGHTIMGGSNIGLSSTFEDMVASNCSTCKVKDDKSAYWTPQLYYEFANKTYASVDHGGMLVYYLQRGGDNETIKAFPDGLRMLAGNPLLRNNTNTVESSAISWNCIDYNVNHPETPGFDITTCPNGLRAQVFFPSCWDGVNLDSTDHKSHMAYPSQMNNGFCPPSHPVHLISIFYELYYSVDPFNKLNDGGRFVLANGDPTGYGLHGDFLNGWNKDVLQRAVDTCTADSGVIEDCGVFTNEGRLYTDDENNQCSAPNPLNVPVDGSMPHLPGCVAVSEGPGQASATALVPGCVSGGTTGVASVPLASQTASASASTKAVAISSVVTSSSTSAAASSPAPSEVTSSAGAGTTSLPTKESSSAAVSATASIPVFVPAPGDMNILSTVVSASSAAQPASSAAATGVALPSKASSPAASSDTTSDSGTCNQRPHHKIPHKHHRSGHHGRSF